MKRNLRSYPTTVLAIGLLVLVGLAPRVMAQANIVGQWSTLPYTMTINPIHVALLHTGEVLVVAGSGNSTLTKEFQAATWNPASGTITTQTVGWDMFCNGMVVLPDGRPFIDGGTTQYNPFKGAANVSVFDPGTDTFTNLPSMARGRWYPTVTTLADGTVMTFSGLDGTGLATDSNVEIFTPSTGSWSSQYAAGWTPALYPRMHVLPSGNVFYSGPTTKSRYYYPSTHKWSSVEATTNYANTRTYGSSVLFPLTPANNYKPVVMIFGGGQPTATATTEIIDLSLATPVWQWGPNMSEARVEMNAVLLPSGKILALGGSVTDENASTASLNADLFDPASSTFSSAGANAYARLYHSVALLLPDATVWVAGGNPQRGTYESHMEIYQPAYLFTTDANGHPILAPRPTISSAPATVGYAGTFTVQTPDATNISSVVLIKAGSVTHSFDMDQRLVGLSYTVGAGSLTVTGPPNANIATPGYYLLFIVNSTGVPSIASFVQVTSGPDFSVTASPPVQGITLGASPTYNVQVVPSGGFAGTTTLSLTGLPNGATDSFSPTQITGSGSSTLTIDTAQLPPPNYPATYPLTVGGTSGSLSRTSPITLVVNSPGDFSLSASPATLTVTRGGSSAKSTITLAGSGGFVGTTNFTVSGLPGPNVTATFNPTSVVGSGVTTLSVQATAVAQKGTYKLTITGTSGTISHTTTVTVTVQ